MSHIIVDRRKNTRGKSTDNRRRFVKRVKDQVRDAVKKVIRSGNIKDMLSTNKKKISIPGKGLSKPEFNHNGSGGVRDQILTGNEDFDQGDRIPRPRSGQGEGGGSGASKDGRGEDPFQFSLTQEEFLELFFEDLELPDMVQKQITKIEEFVNRRAGFSVDGSPDKLNIIRSMKSAKGRRFALRNPKKKELKELERQREALLAEFNSMECRSDIEADECNQKIKELDAQIAALKRKIKAIPFIDNVDLRYNRWDKVPIPTTQAVMFGIMDVSGSMGEWEKEMAKRFFMLLLLFLTYNYQRVDIVWIRHHTEASEVDENEFFYSRESGGTMVSPALKLMKDIIDARYPVAHWNIFGCQISDGDNWPEDNASAIKILDEQLLPISRYFAYIEILRRGNRDDSVSSDSLRGQYELLKPDRQNLEIATISGAEDIYPVFRSLFEKRK